MENRVVVEEVEHSKRGASSANRWRACSGSINLTDKLIAGRLIKPKQSRVAAEGTAAHLVLTTCLEDGSDAHEMKDIIIEIGDWSFSIDDEMIQGVQETLDWIRKRIAKAESEGYIVNVYVEKNLSSFTDEEAFGTPDIIIHIVDDRLIVVDFKYGRGVSVEPTSDQNYYYGYLAVENYLETLKDVKVVESWIAQPRIPHPDGKIRKHITDPKELADWWFKELLPDMARTKDPEAELTVGEHCRFCPNRSHCPALKSEIDDFSVEVTPSHLTDEELGRALNKIDAILTVKEAFEKEAFNRARKGNRILGRKLVKKKGNREWKNSQPVKVSEDSDKMVVMTVIQAIEMTFGLDAYSEPNMKSPAQIEHLDNGKEFTAKWAFSPDKGLTLAKASDKRPEVSPNVERFYNQMEEA